MEMTQRAKLSSVAHCIMKYWVRIVSFDMPNAVSVNL